MIDNIKLYLPRCRDMPDIGGWLDTGAEQNDITTGEAKVFGKVGNIKVSQRYGGYTIQGSLPKFLYGDNVSQLTRKDVGTAIEKLSDRLHLPLCDADITSIEVGANFCLSKPTGCYTRLLGSMPRLQRKVMAGSVYYQGMGKYHPREYYFYNKIEEVRAKGGIVPAGFGTANMLRYEMRLQGRLTKQLSIPEFKASTLQDRAVYKELVKRWLDGYLSIDKLQDMNDDGLKEVASIKGAKEILFSQLIAKAGGSSAIEEFVSKLKAESGLAGKRDAISRVRSSLYEIASISSLRVDNSLIGELTSRVKQMALDS